MGYSFHFICGLLRRHVVQRNVFGGSAAGVCEIGFEGPTKYVALVPGVWDKSQERLQMDGAFRTRGAWRPSRSIPTSTAFATTNFPQMVGAHSADAAAASELGQSQACGWIAQGISGRTSAGSADDRQVAEGDEIESMPESALQTGSATQAKVSDGGSSEQSGLDCGFQRLVSDWGWSAGSASDCARSLQSLFAGRSLAEVSALEDCKTHFSSAVSRKWLSDSHSSGQRPTLRIYRAAWAFALERVVDGVGNPRRIYCSRASRTEWRARANASGSQGRDNTADFQAFTSSATAHQPLVWRLQPDSTARGIGAKSARGGLSPSTAEAATENSFEIFEPMGSAPCKEQRANQMAWAQTIYWRGICRISDRPEFGGQGKICRLFCWLGDWRPLGLGYGGHAAGPVPTQVLKKLADRTSSVDRRDPKSAHSVLVSASLRLATLASTKRRPTRCLLCRSKDEQDV